jgi:hypothetical protein
VQLRGRLADRPPRRRARPADLPRRHQRLPHRPADVEGGTGDDRIRTADSADLVDGGPGKDTIDGYLGDDVLRGGDGDDTVRGEFGADTLVGGPGADTILGGMDDDTIDARDGEVDAVRCDEGADTVEADAADVVHADCETVRLPKPPVEIKPPGEPTPTPGDGRAPGGEVRAAPGQDPPVVPVVADLRPQPGPASQADRRAPRLTVVTATRRRGRVTLTVRCDEACTVSARAGRKIVRRALRAGAKGRLVVSGRRVVLTATDAAGNAARRTVKR